MRRPLVLLLLTGVAWGCGVDFSAPLAGTAAELRVTVSLVDSLPVGEVRRFEEELLRYIDAEQKALRLEIAKNKALDPDLTARLKAAVAEFKTKRFIPRASA